MNVFTAITIAARAVEWLNVNSGAVMAIFTVILVVVTAYYAIETSKMSRHMEAANQLTFRPYILIQGAPNSFIKNLIISKSNTGISLANIAEGYSFTALKDVNTDIDYFVYSLKNTGNVPANSLNHLIAVFHLDNSNKRTKIDIPDNTFTNREVIFSGDQIIRQIELGKNIIYREASNESIEIQITIKYDGSKKLNDNRFYTYKAIKIPIIKDPSEMTSIAVLDEDEGIEGK